MSSWSRSSSACNSAKTLPPPSARALLANSWIAAYFTSPDVATLTGYAKEQSRRQSLAQADEADEKALVIADDLYRHGLADFLRVLESQRALYQTQDALAESDRAVASDLIALYKALGGGWEEQKEVSSSTAR